MRASITARIRIIKFLAQITAYTVASQLAHVHFRTIAQHFATSEKFSTTEELGGTVGWDGTVGFTMEMFKKDFVYTPLLFV